ncbi:hypothetical protein ACFL27_26025, partial [candidate division CSSED10-310 bacterium]
NPPSAKIRARSSVSRPALARVEGRLFALSADLVPEDNRITCYQNRSKIKTAQISRRKRARKSNQPQ